MSDTVLNAAAARENANSLAVALGIDVGHAEELLAASVLVTAIPEDEPGARLAQQVCEILARTLRHVGVDVDPAVAEIEVVIGGASPRTKARMVWVSVDEGRASVSRHPIGAADMTRLHPAESLVLACYVASAAIRIAADDTLPYPQRDTLELDLQALGVTSALSSQEIDLGRAYLAGAGAIGNAFLWALRWFGVTGQLDIVDYDTVKSGNLNRQIWFDDSDVGKAKAECLAGKAQPFFKQLTLVPRNGRLQDLPDKETDDWWLRRLIVAVDSRPARRSLQAELPGEVFDASTTDISEVVFHFNRQPTDLACLGCIYPPDTAEIGRARDIAAAFGVTVDDVRQGVISPVAAGNILARYPEQGLTSEGLEEEAYESLFKALCGQSRIQSPDGRQVFAPFAFVSVLAGTLLAIEVAKRLSGGEPTFNFWRVNPWLPFSTQLQRQRVADPECCVLGSSIIRRINQDLWEIN